MKRFTTIALVALLALAALVVPATAQMESVEVRGPVFNGTDINAIIADQGVDGTTLVMDAYNFAGFFYDLESGDSTESLNITSDDAATEGRVIGANDLVYTTTIETVEYEATFDDVDQNGDAIRAEYPILGLFAEKYIPLTNTTPDKLGKLLLDNDDKYTLRTGSALELPNGYELTPKQIDVDGNKVWMELSKDGEFIEDQVLDLSGDVTSITWVYEADDVAGEDDIEVFRVRVTDVFQGQVDSLAVVEGLWLMDYEDVLEIEDDDEFGKLSASVGATSLEFTNDDDSLTLTADDVVEIAEGMSFRVANDEDVLRFYPFVELTIEGEETTQPDEEEEMDEEEQVTDNETEGNDTVETPVDETPDETEEPPVEDEGNETTDEGPVPGFEAIFAVAGLLAVAYLVRRN